MRIGQLGKIARQVQAIVDRRRTAEQSCCQSPSGFQDDLQNEEEIGGRDHSHV